MATVTYRIKETKKENTPIYVRFSINSSTRLETRTGFTVNKKEWSKETRLPKRTGDNKILINSLNRLKSYLLDSLNIAQEKGVTLNNEWLKEEINFCFSRSDKKDNQLLITWFNYYIEINTGKLSKNSIKGYNSSKSLISEYETKLKKKLYLTDLTRSFADKYIKWLEEHKQYSVSYINKQISNVKVIVRESQKHDQKINSQILNVKGLTEKIEDRHIVTLTIKEQRKIKETIVEGYLNNAKKWLLIGCSIGQRGGDLLNITSKNIRQENNRLYIDLKQEKTNKDVSIGVSDPYLKDIILNEPPTKISTQNFNKYIKELCRIAEVNELVEGKKTQYVKVNGTKQKRSVLGKYPKHELICSHSCRRTFATMHFESGKLPIHTIMQITGHTLESTFLKYVNKPVNKDHYANMLMEQAQHL